MKKLVAIIAILLFGIFLFGCTGGGQQTQENPKPSPTPPPVFPGLKPMESCEELRFVTPDDLREAGFGTGYSIIPPGEWHRECIYTATHGGVFHYCASYGNCSGVVYDIKKEDKTIFEACVCIDNCLIVYTPSFCVPFGRVPTKTGVINGFNYTIDNPRGISIYQNNSKPIVSISVLSDVNVTDEQLENLAGVLTTKLMNST